MSCDPNSSVQISTNREIIQGSKPNGFIAINDTFYIYEVSSSELQIILPVYDCNGVHLSSHLFGITDDPTLQTAIKTEDIWIVTGDPHDTHTHTENGGNGLLLSVEGWPASVPGIFNIAIYTMGSLLNDPAAILDNRTSSLPIPHNDGPIINIASVQFTEFLEAETVVASDWVNGERRDDTINTVHAPALEVTGYSLVVARKYDTHAEVSCSIMDTEFPDDVVINGVTLEYSDDSTNGLDGTWASVGATLADGDYIPGHVLNTLLECMDPTDCEDIPWCVCEDLVLPTVPSEVFSSPFDVEMDNPNGCDISVVVNTSSLPGDLGEDIGSATVTTANGITTITTTLLLANANIWLHFYCEETYIGYRIVKLVAGHRAYRIVCDCDDGEWVCPGGGLPAVWIGYGPPIGTPPTCT